MSDPKIYSDITAIKKELLALKRQEGGAIAGTWTPTLSGSGGAGSLTQSPQIGAYVRIGTTVVVHGYVAVSALVSAPTGDLRIALPFTTMATANAFQSLSIAQYSRINLAANVVQISLRLEPGTIYGILIENYDDLDVTVVQGSAIRVGSIVIFGGSYICEA